jgi:hypothetical protein
MPGRVALDNHGAAPLTVQLAQSGLRPLNIVLPPGCSLVVRAGVEPFRTRIATRFGVNLVDELIDLRTDGSLGDASGVALTLSVADVAAMSDAHPSAAIAAAYIMVRTGHFHEAAGAIAALASRLAPGSDLLLLQAEMCARAGDHAQAITLFLRAAGEGLPMLSSGLSYLVDRLRMYMQSTPGPDGDAVRMALAGLQRVATRCDFNLVFTNFTGASPAKSGDEVVDDPAPALFTLQVAGRSTSKESIMATQYVTQEQLDDLAKAISSAGFEAMGGGPDIRTRFCEVWPSVEPGLTALQEILSMVPGVSAFAGPAIGIVKAAGAAAAKGVCQR